MAYNRSRPVSRAQRTFSAGLTRVGEKAAIRVSAVGESREDSQAPLCVTYWMNLLQSLETSDPLLLTLNPVHEPAPGTIVREFEYSHPFFDKAALSSQRELWSLQGRRRTWFCGSYFGFGFHEDALQSGLAVAEQLGGLVRPWKVAGQFDRLRMISDEQAAAA